MCSHSNLLKLQKNGSWFASRRIHITVLTELRLKSRPLKISIVSSIELLRGRRDLPCY